MMDLILGFIIAGLLMAGEDLLCTKFFFLSSRFGAGLFPSYYWQGQFLYLLLEKYRLNEIICFHL